MALPISQYGPEFQTWQRILIQVVLPESEKAYRSIHGKVVKEAQTQGFPIERARELLNDYYKYWGNEVTRYDLTTGTDTEGADTDDGHVEPPKKRNRH